MKITIVSQYPHDMWVVRVAHDANDASQLAVLKEAMAEIGWQSDPIVTSPAEGVHVDQFLKKGTDIFNAWTEEEAGQNEVDLRRVFSHLGLSFPPKLRQPL